MSTIASKKVVTTKNGVLPHKTVTIALFVSITFYNVYLNLIEWHYRCT